MVSVVFGEITSESKNFEIGKWKREGKRRYNPDELVLECALHVTAPTVCSTIN